MRINIENKNISIETDGRESILSVFQKQNIDVPAPCSGRGICNKCKVKLVCGKVSGDKPDQNGLIRSCKAFPLCDITVSIPDTYMGAGEVAKIANGNGRKIGKAGIALDIGTTTVSAMLIDLTDGTEIDTISSLNPQRIYGADVMSRINACMNGQLENLHKITVSEINRIIFEFKSRNEFEFIEKIAVSANTTMLHILANRDPSSMGVVPFKPLFTDNLILSGLEIGVDCGELVLLPSVSAFIGADVVSGIAAAGFIKSPEPVLYVDIGTNGEAALINNGKILCCSTAAGPALEGAEIECGTGGVYGAVNKVYSDGEELKFTVIGGVAPSGICGSGLIDAVSVMLKTGCLDSTGALNDVKNSYFDGEKLIMSDIVYICGKDIRQYQTAKSAIRSGLNILLKRGGISLDALSKLDISGGLGFFIDIENACFTGLLPDLPRSKITASGNMSLKGAAMLMKNQLTLSDFENVKKACVSIELASDPDFMDEFMDNMFF